MKEISCLRSFCFLLFLSSFSRLLVSGSSDDLSNPKNDAKFDAHSTSGRNNSTVVLICLLLVAVALLSFFLFKFWQKKKREEQYARLLKLFEEDDELELELGLRD